MKLAEMMAGPKAEQSESKGGASMGGDVAADALFDAIQSNDREAFKAALRSCFRLGSSYTKGE